MAKRRALLLVLGMIGFAPFALAAELNGLRGPTPLTEEAMPAPLPNEVNDDVRQVRNYPEQPPVIPHSIRDYRIDLRSNKCLSCHSRRLTEATQAIPVSVTHYMDRDGQTLGAISPRRYFCTQCHVSQLDAAPPVGNDFVDIDTILMRSRGEGLE